MKSIVQKYNSTSLILRIIIGLVIGAILGLVVPQATGIGILGELFVGALKAIAPILVFVLIISALARANSGIGGQFRTVILLYLLNTFLAAVLAVAMSYAFPTTITLAAAAEDQKAPSGIVEVLTSLLKNLVDNPVNALANANYLGILMWSVIFGLALKFVASGHLKESLGNISEGVSTAVRWIINLAPFGICGLVFNSVSQNGLDIFVDYGKLIVLLVGTMLIMAFGVMPAIVFGATHRNPYPLVVKCLRDSGITAFFTRSSAANIPVNMSLCNQMGLNKDLYSVSIPLGATVNMNGAAITITILSMVTCNTLGINVDIPSAIILSFLATASACGASGVAGGSLLLIPMACSLFGVSNDVSMQVVGVGFIIGVIQDSCETAINSSGDVVFAAAAEFRHKIRAGEPVDMSWKALNRNAEKGHEEAEAIKAEIRESASEEGKLSDETVEQIVRDEKKTEENEEKKE